MTPDNPDRDTTGQANTTTHEEAVACFCKRIAALEAESAISRLGFTSATLAVAIKLAEAAEASKEARLATGRQSTCNKQAHGDSHIQCGKCFICLERQALAEWASLGE